jgi:hypothetical protein
VSAQLLGTPTTSVVSRDFTERLKREHGLTDDFVRLEPVADFNGVGCRIVTHDDDGNPRPDRSRVRYDRE